MGPPGNQWGTHIWQVGSNDAHISFHWFLTVKGQSRSDSLLLSPYHWAKLFRGVVAIVAVPMRFAVIC